MKSNYKSRQLGHVCHSAISICAIMRKIKALHIICICLYFDSTAAFVFQPENKMPNKLRVPGKEGKSRIQRGIVGGGGPGDLTRTDCIFKMPFASLWFWRSPDGKLITFINNTPGMQLATCNLQQLLLPRIGRLYKACTFLFCFVLFFFFGLLLLLWLPLFAKTKCPN